MTENKDAWKSRYLTDSPFGLEQIGIELQNNLT